MRDQPVGVLIPVGRNVLQGELALPRNPRGVVIFAHGSGSSRHSSRNQYVARYLTRCGFATLLIDLLTEDEQDDDECSSHLRFDIARLAVRLVAIVDWVSSEPELASLPVGLFGASTAGSAALVAAAEHPNQVAAVVSRGGRPDLAGAALSSVMAPTLLLVGGDDAALIALNREGMSRMHCRALLQVVPGASHQFEEPGPLEAVATAAGLWFQRFLSETSEDRFFPNSAPRWAWDPAARVPLPAPRR
ncbi:MAG TPA: dienelactone hydrolase family protein [Vicinamibacterales bacterium]|nr:dienelactone hydrolase family protein [Vicinamibacterales bacterium]